MKSDSIFLPVYGVVGLIVLWYLAVWVRVVDPVLLPPPQDAFQALWKGMAGGRLAYDFWRTVERTAYAIAIAAALAIPLGIFLGANEKLYRTCEFVIDFFRSTPASAMFPLFLVIFGVGDTTKILVAAFGAALVVLFNVAYGVMNARKTRLLAAKVMGASRLRVLTDVMLLESLPQTFVGLRNGARAGDRGGRRDVHRLDRRPRAPRLRVAAAVRHAGDVRRDLRRRRARLRPQPRVYAGREALRALVREMTP